MLQWIYHKAWSVERCMWKKKPWCVKWFLVPLICKHDSTLLGARNTLCVAGPRWREPCSTPYCRELPNEKPSSSSHVNFTQGKNKITRWDQRGIHGAQLHSSALLCLCEQAVPNRNLLEGQMPLTIRLGWWMVFCHLQELLGLLLSHHQTGTSAVYSGSFHLQALQFPFLSIASYAIHHIAQKTMYRGTLSYRYYCHMGKGKWFVTASEIRESKPCHLGVCGKKKFQKHVLEEEVTQTRDKKINSWKLHIILHKEINHFGLDSYVRWFSKEWMLELSKERTLYFQTLMFLSLKEITLKYHLITQCWQRQFVPTS